MILSAVLPMIMTVICLVAGINHLIYFRQGVNRNENLAFMFTCFSVTLYQIATALYFMAVDYNAALTATRYIYVVSPFIYISFIWFVFYFCEQQKKWISFMLTLMYALFFVAIVFKGNDILNLDGAHIYSISLFGHSIANYFKFEHGIVMQLYSLLKWGTILYLLAVVLNYIRKSTNKIKGIVVFFLFLLAIGGLNDGLLSAEIIQSIYIGHYVFVLVIGAMEFYYVKTLYYYLGKKR